MAKKRRPKLIPLQYVSPPHVEPALAHPWPPYLALLRRVLTPLWFSTERSPLNYWFVTLLNDNTALEYAQQYVVDIPAKSSLPPWTAQELAIACAEGLNEYRGWVTLQRFEEGSCVFASAFVSNSLFTSCVYSTDSAECMPVPACPDGWQPGQPLPPGLKRAEVSDIVAASHHTEKDPTKLSKLAKKALP